MSALHIDIRDACVEDAAEVFEVHQLTAEERRTWPASLAECREHIGRMLALGNPPQVAAADGRVVAEMEVWWGEDVAEFGRSLDVSMLYVHPSWQCRGVGTALIEHAAGMAASGDCTCVTVCYDEPAEGFYRKVGFTDGIELTYFRLAVGSCEPAPAARWTPVTLAAMEPPRGRHIRTERMKHPAQHWALVRLEEAEPPPNISAFHVEVAGVDTPLLAVFRRATWDEKPWRAMPYVWAPQWDRRAFDAVIACARDAGIRTLDIWVYGEMVGVLRARGAEVRGHDSILTRRLEQRTTNNEQRRS